MMYIKEDKRSTLSRICQNIWSVQAVVLSIIKRNGDSQAVSRTSHNTIIILVNSKENTSDIFRIFINLHCGCFYQVVEG